MKRSRRTFSNEFKRQVIEEYLGGDASQAQLCRRYEISPTLMREWRRKYDAGELEGSNTPPDSHRERELMRRVADLERKIGQLTMENEVLLKRGALPRRRRGGSGLIASGPKPSASREDAR